MTGPRRWFVTGTDTDIGKTRVAAALMHALTRAGRSPTIVKLVQTGLPPGVSGDAEDVAEIAGYPAEELRRYALAADPWSAAIAEERSPPRVAELAADVARLHVPGDLVIEGSGGIAVPLNADETFLDLAVALRTTAILAVGLRLGCISHARLTLAALAARGVAVAGAVLVARFGPADPDYVRQVVRGLDAHVALLGVMAYEPDAARGAYAASALFDPLARSH